MKYGLFCKSECKFTTKSRILHRQNENFDCHWRMFVKNSYDVRGLVVGR